MKTRERGFSLVTAVFLMVIVASLGAYMVTIGTTQQQTSTLSILEGRAFAAAESGVEWGIAQVLSADACFGSPVTFSLTGGAAADYSISATCASTSHIEGAATFNVFRIGVTASRGVVGNSDYVQRSMRAVVTTAP
jgi:MSHA biogenesis protein MshP